MMFKCYKDIFCLGTVPVVEAEEGQYVYESLVTVDFLEELYPERSTLAKDPFRRAIDRIIVEANKTVGIFNIFLLLYIFIHISI